MPSVRSYDNSGRAAAARETRRCIVAAARELFLEKGYVATTLAVIAERAGVSGQTVYAQFGNKQAIAKQIVDEAIVGDDEPIALADREAIGTMMAEPDPYARLRLQAALTTTVHARGEPVDRVLRSGAEVDPALKQLLESSARGRVEGMRMMAAFFDSRGELKVPVEEAAERAAALLGADLYRCTVVEQGWEPEAFTLWLGDLLIASLLPPRPAGRRR